MPIRVLDDATAARIAAGEVVERPSSVVKELVENSLDAGVTRVDVEVKDGGLGLIHVVDNGRGIPPDELDLAFERFATSKVSSDSDLSGIGTLGFRGEALPSIASVSVVEAASRMDGDDRGEFLRLEFGSRQERGGRGMPAGTSIRVSRLFTNVPARKKFLRSPGTELGRLHQVISAYALARPDVAFKLISDGRTRLQTDGYGNLHAAVARVYGSSVADAMLEVAPPAEGPDTPGTPAFSVAGLTSSPSLTRGNRNFIVLTVNGRWIQSRRIAFAVEQAYHGFLGERRFPVSALHIRAPKHDLDVNVHPAKTEIRFLREDLVFSETQRAVRSTLIATSPVRSVPSGMLRSRGPDSVSGPSHDERPRGTSTPLTNNPLWPALDEDEEEDVKPKEAGQLGMDMEEGASRAATESREPENPEGSTHGAEASRHTPRNTLPVLRVIGQAQETYVVAEGPDGVYLIDQHAAHERVRYEEISSYLGAEHAPSQQLLQPEPVELDPRQEEFLTANAELVQALGFGVEAFGPGAVLLRSLPQILAERISGGAGDALVQMLDEVLEGRRADAWQERFKATLACHSSVRAGQRISEEEARELVRRLERAEQPHTCPHGRPTMVHMSGADLARGFQRR
ncbi:MAG: DNA mismatch repair endonuclease MutL [Chloroflexota bacterium]